MLVDDHPIVRQGLALVLGQQKGIEIASSVGDGASALGALSQQPDVILLDLELPDTSGLELLPQLAQQAAVVILTAYEKPSQIKLALELGAKGFLLKGACSEEIRNAVRAAARGEVYLQPRLASALLGPPRDLSPRERGVLGLLVQGCSNAQIASKLIIAERTVKFHVSSLFNKLEVSNRTEAAALAVEQGLV